MYFQENPVYVSKNTPQFLDIGTIFRYFIRLHIFSKIIASEPDETRQDIPWL